MTLDLHDSGVAITSTFVAIEVAFGYSAFLPSIMTIGTFVDSADKVRMIRQGEMVATAFALGLAVVVSFVVKNPLPVIVSGLTCAGMIAIYEFSLRQSPYLTGES